MNWYGLQFVRKMKGTGDIVQRSFPFWLTTIEEGITHAHRTNALPKEERSYWTHIVVWAAITETKQGRRKNEVPVEEIKL